MENSTIIELATGMITGNCPAEFSDKHTNSKALRDMFIEANGGSDKINIKTFHRGNPCFDILEEIIPVIVHEGFTGNEFWMNLVEYRNIELGDELEFITEDKTDFIVSDLSYGTSGIRRQRLGESESYTVQTRLKGIKIYDEFKRFMAKRVDFDKFVQKVSKAMLDRLNEDIYNAFTGVTESTRGLSSEYVITGTNDEDEVLDLAEHVSAANGGAKVIILGSKKALRGLPSTNLSDQAKADLYNLGYFGNFFGHECVFMPQRHKPGTNEFMFDDKKLYIIPVGMDKPIKVVNMGVGYIFDQVVGNPLTGDLTSNYTYAQDYGVGLAFNAKMGFYTQA